MLKQCPTCDKTTGLEIIERPEEFEIKGEKITIQVNLYHCNECGSEFSTNELGDPFKKAYEEYRKLKGMVQPYQITQFRKKYDLSQKELSNLLGFGDVTLSRYENGSLQDQVHDNILKLVMNPQNLLQLVNRNRSLFSAQKNNRLVSLINQELSINDQFSSLIGENRSDEYTGGTQLIIRKVGEVIEFLCFNREVFKTKLMKLLFYSDFIHYKSHDKSITGLCYVHLPFGPVPDDYDLLIGALLRINQNIYLEPIEFGKYSGEIIRIKEPKKIEFLSKEELETLRLVSSRFDYYSSKELSIFSHQEKAYLETSHCELIPYRFAKTLSLD